MHSNILHSVKATRVSNAVAAGTSDINTTGLDMSGFDGVVWSVSFGTITAGAVTSLKVQGDTDSGFGTAVDLVGPTLTVNDDDDNQTFLIECRYVPDYRYLRLVVDRGTQNAVVDSVVAYQYSDRKQPVTHDATTIGDSIVAISPRPTSTSFTSTTISPSGITRVNQTSRTSS